MNTKTYDLRKKRSSDTIIHSSFSKKAKFIDDDEDDEDWINPPLLTHKKRSNKIIESGSDDEPLIISKDSLSLTSENDADEVYSCSPTCSEEEESNESSEYFDYDKTNIIDAVTERVRTKFSSLNLPEDKLKEVVKISMDKARDDIFDDYCGNKPSDTRWKVGLSEERIKKLEPELKALRDEMTTEIPTMCKILEARIPKNDKKKALRLFDILNNTEPFTTEYFAYEDHIKTILESEKQFEGINIEDMEEKERVLKAVKTSSARSLRISIINLDAADSVKSTLLEMYDDMERYNPSDTEYNTMFNKIKTAISLPYRRVVKAELPLNATSKQIDDYCVTVRKRMDTYLHAMTVVKEMAIETVNNRFKNPSSKSLMALKGEPGVGKTAVAKALALSLNIPFDRISLGGLQDATFLKGQDNSWVGASPSIFLQILKKMKYSNGIVLLDEIDKLTGDKGKEVQHALLHIIDYTQNDEFTDSYLREFPHDLSKIWFIVAMNDDKTLDPAIKDRLTIIPVKSYTYTEKVEIVQNFMLPKSLTNVGLSVKDVTIDAIACGTIISRINSITGSKKKGLRSIEQILSRLCSRINMLITSGDENNLKLSYFIKGIELPLHITPALVNHLWPENVLDEDMPDGVKRMYI